jgi:hypothetical protein
MWKRRVVAGVFDQAAYLGIRGFAADGVRDDGFADGEADLVHLALDLFDRRRELLPEAGRLIDRLGNAREGHQSLHCRRERRHSLSLSPASGAASACAAVLDVRAHMFAASPNREDDEIRRERRSVQDKALESTRR